ncbi:eukaryotic translation initiation factor 4 gamma-like isoform X2 [Dendronephthya gigantea]|uniref:eukaryotic translation initiation factor 4 gamma-like isoform X2 n=1 Tax=Dendronephthya gigantea TaxID=151771 RepID=UPI00106BB050|nr:eukaryotic translation initiation factor 4 gamma-like isoform X2 [Dendronephthya gigantea]
MSDSSQPWYHGQMSAEEATAICLKVGQNGAFLVRDSQGGKGVFTLSIFFDGEVYHHRITPSGKNVIMESTTKKFKSLKKLVKHYMNPTVDFFHPLTVAIFPSLVQQLKANDQNVEPSVSVNQEPLYIRRQGTVTVPPTQIPKPVFPPNVPISNRPVLKKTDTPPQSSKQDDIQPNMSKTPSLVPSIPSQSPSAAFTPDELNWPEPPSPITAPASVPPPIKPKPINSNLRRRTRSDVTELRETVSVNAPSQASSIPEERLTTFKPIDVYDIPDGTADNGQPIITRRRTLSFEEAKKLQEDRQGDSTNKPKSPHFERDLPQNTTQSTSDKKSKLKSFAHFLSSIGKAQSSRKNVTQREKKDIKIEHIVEQKEETMNAEKTQDREGNSVENNDNSDADNEAAIAQDYTPILCKTQFLTTVDYNSSDNAMSYATGVEMAVKGVRVDGWWYCVNKATLESGWVHMDYLKPKSNEKWFEAKPVETIEDHQLYDRLNFGLSQMNDNQMNDDDLDSDFDDDNYCKYLIPSDDVNTGGHVDNGTVS